MRARGHTAGRILRRLETEQNRYVHNGWVLRLASVKIKIGYAPLGRKDKKASKNQQNQVAPTRRGTTAAA